MDLLVDLIINAKKITGRHDRLVVQISVEVVSHCKSGEGNLENSEQDYFIFFGVCFNDSEIILLSHVS